MQLLSLWRLILYFVSLVQICSEYFTTDVFARLIRRV